MTDEMLPRAAAAADTALNIYALSGDIEREALLGSMIACAAAHREMTPRQLLGQLLEAMPSDEDWTTSESGERTKRKCRNTTRWFRGAQIHYVGRGNQG